MTASAVRPLHDLLFSDYAVTTPFFRGSFYECCAVLLLRHCCAMDVSGVGGAYDRGVDFLGRLKKATTSPPPQSKVASAAAISSRFNYATTTDSSVIARDTKSTAREFISPRNPTEVRVIGQCKQLFKPVGAAIIRDLESVVRNAEAGTMGVLVSSQGLSQEGHRQFLTSNLPLLQVCFRAESPILWQTKASNQPLKADQNQSKYKRKEESPVENNSEAVSSRKIAAHDVLLYLDGMRMNAALETLVPSLEIAKFIGNDTPHVTVDSIEVDNLGAQTSPLRIRFLARTMFSYAL